MDNIAPMQIDNSTEKDVENTLEVYSEEIDLSDVVTQEEDVFTDPDYVLETEGDDDPIEEAVEEGVEEEVLEEASE